MPVLKSRAFNISRIPADATVGFDDPGKVRWRACWRTSRRAVALAVEELHRDQRVEEISDAPGVDSVAARTRLRSSDAPPGGKTLRNSTAVSTFEGPESGRRFADERGVRSRGFN